jgi:hypothetical protein
MEAFVTKDPADITFAALDFVADLLNQRKVHAQDADPNAFWCQEGNNKFMRYVVTPQGLNSPELQAMHDRGWLIRDALFNVAMERLEHLSQTLSLIADEYLTTHKRQQDAYTVSAPSWAPAGQSDPPASLCLFAVA